MRRPQPSGKIKKQSYGWRVKHRRLIKCPDTGECFSSYRDYLQSNHWHRFKVGYFTEHPRVCKDCGSDKAPIHLHHLTCDRVGYELHQDVKPLCAQCHKAAEAMKQKPKKGWKKRKGKKKRRR